LRSSWFARAHTLGTLRPRGLRKADERDRVVIPYPALGVLAVNELIFKPAVGRSQEPLESAAQRNERVPRDAAAVRFSIHRTQPFSDIDVWSACAEHQLQRSYTGQWLNASRFKGKGRGRGKSGVLGGSD
jgi:hypothetical protein